MAENAFSLPSIEKNPIECPSGNSSSTNPQVRLCVARSTTYYAGKPIANEDGTTYHLLKGVRDKNRCVVEGDPDEDQLRSEFQDKDGDELVRFVIYDYGPGDGVTVAAWAAFDGSQAN